MSGDVVRRVLMISPHFPPDSTAGTHRVRLLAPHLAAHGWRPTVLTVDPRDYEGRLDPELAAGIPSDLHVVRCRAWPARLTRPFGVGDLGLRALTGLWCGAVGLMSREQFDAVFVTIYPTYPALLGPRLKRRFRTRFVLDYQDPWVGEWGRSVGSSVNGGPDLKSRVSRALGCACEPIALGAADAVTAVSRATFEQALARNPGVKPLATLELPIGWDRGDFERLARRAGAPGRRPSDDLFRITYVGTLLPTGLDTLEALFAAIDRLRHSDPRLIARLRLRFVGTSNERRVDAPARVMPIARQSKIEEIVSEEPSRLDYFDALQALADADAVLLLGSREAHYTPSKVFPALLTGRPLLALYHEASTACELLRGAGGPPFVRLVTYSDHVPAADTVGAVADQLRQMLLTPDRQLRQARRFDSLVGGSPLSPLLESTSAYALAGHLAGVLDTVARGEPCVASV